MKVCDLIRVLQSVPPDYEVWLDTRSETGIQQHGEFRINDYVVRCPPEWPVFKWCNGKPVLERDGSHAIDHIETGFGQFFLVGLVK